MAAVLREIVFFIIIIKTNKLNNKNEHKIKLIDFVFMTKIRSLRKRGVWCGEQSHASHSSSAGIDL